MKRVAILASVLALCGSSLLAQARQPIRIQMKQVGSRYLFDPANFTVRVGDVVDFVNVSGFPHNVAFEPARIPAGAADVMNRAMANRMGPLQGPMMTQAGQTYRVSFAGAPVGTYDYFCLPHKALGMTGRITVQAR